jgi:hypothetical protein
VIEKDLPQPGITKNLFVAQSLMETGILKSNNMFNDKEKFGSTENDRDKKKN